MTHEEILSMLGDYVDYLIANSSAEAPMWNIEKVRRLSEIFHKLRSIHFFHIRENISIHCFP